LNNKGDDDDDKHSIYQIFLYRLKRDRKLPHSIPRPLNHIWILALCAWLQTQDKSNSDRCRWLTRLVYQKQDHDESCTRNLQVRSDVTSSRCHGDSVSLLQHHSQSSFCYGRTDAVITNDSRLFRMENSKV